MLDFSNTGKLQKLYARHTGQNDMPDAVRKQLDVKEAYWPETLISNAPFVIFDTETTGLNLEGGDRLLSLGAVKIIAGRIHMGDAFYELIDPKRPIPTSSIFIHGITPGIASARPHISGVLLRFLAYIGSDVIVAHHACFDMKFLNCAMRSCFGFPIQNRVIDTALAAAWIWRMEKAELIDETSRDTRFDAVAAHFGITAVDRHTAFGDALSTALLFQRFINILNRNGVKTLRQLVRIAGV
ncbi:MAG: 3'-5' exonuclease [Deltaproteobacteria bacterium]|nr:3'-5' exonuclease [Deltaproteobacteria bacterium]MBW1792891.1 3'-5' exonuclease [Deltaproteobacteria bacterium]MBW2329609.1 3'-5' exonuclease [Deltaproteobacteria bacterium]